MRILRVIYVLGIAVVLVLLVVAGVEAFYPCPQYGGYPDYPDYPMPVPDYDSPEYEEWQQEYEEWEQEWEEFQEEYTQQEAIHARNVFYIVLPLGVVFAIMGIFLQRRLDIFGAGLILGGIGTMIFAIVPYDLEAIPRFIGIAVILAVLIFVGYKVLLPLRKNN
jgi:hypothetical protein